MHSSNLFFAIQTRQKIYTVCRYSMARYAKAMAMRQQKCWQRFVKRWIVQ